MTIGCAIAHDLVQRLLPELSQNDWAKHERQYERGSRSSDHTKRDVAEDVQEVEASGVRRQEMEEHFSVDWKGNHACFAAHRSISGTNCSSLTPREPFKRITASGATRPASACHTADGS